MYKPDNWVIIKIDYNNDVFYKVLGGWSGGYLDGDSWRLNSGIKKVEKDGDFYLFHGHSGSIYKCHKDSETLRINNAGAWGAFESAHPNYVKIVPVEEINLENSTI